MGDGSRWERWPYKVLGYVLMLAWFGVRLLPSLSPHARSVATIAGSPFFMAGAVLVGRSQLHRIRKARDAEIRRNPSGKTVPLEDRLAQVQHPRARWAAALGWALASSLATGWAIYLAISHHKSAFVGFAILGFILAACFWWATWRMRALRHRRG